MQMNSAARLSAQEFESELTRNILPFWANNTLDRENGGFYGALSSSNEINNKIERSAVLCGRILWTFSQATLKYQQETHLDVAKWAHQYLSSRFWDDTFEGIYWSLDREGKPVMDRKHTYAQAFAIYGLTAYTQASQDNAALELAKRLFHLIDTHTYDPVYGGNIECLSREWTMLEDMRLSDKDLNSSKSMNTLLHLTEAYAALAVLWKDPLLLQRLEELVDLFIERIINSKTGHQLLFFDNKWTSLSNHISYGHDIETSWLLLEAAQALGDPQRIQKAQSLAVKMAQAVYDEALSEDGSILYEASPDGYKELSKQWWAHAEAVVGFYNAFQLSGKEHFYQASVTVWDYIQSHFIDHKGGDWFKLLDQYGNPVLTHTKAGPWDCPYHHARMCMEMTCRLDQ